MILVNGDTQWVNCRNNPREEILKWLNLLKTQSGNTTGFRYRKFIHTDNPSIQGPWTPYTFKEPAENLAIFPNNELSRPAKLKKTATEQLAELFDKGLNIENKRAE